MQWSKVRKRVENSFAPSVRGRVTVHSTNSKQKGEPRRCLCGWGWLAIDSNPIAKFDTHASYDKYANPYHETTIVTRFGTGPHKGHPSVPDSERFGSRLAEPGEFSRFDLHEACWFYLHSSLNDSVASENPLVLSLAVLNAKVGKQRLRRIAQRKLHPLTRALLELRMEAEGVGPEQEAARLGGVHSRS
jgi:hypothetical protein